MRIILIVFFLFAKSIIYAQGYICAVGGGSEDYGEWSDSPYGWIVEKASFGNVIVLSYSDQTDWIPNYFESFGAASAENLKINSRTVAEMQETYDAIVSAQAVFIKGGDQWRYVNYWKGTKTEGAILQVFLNGGVVAGTSAGAAVLSDVVFTAQYGSAYSKESLSDPFYNRITLDDDFLNLVPNTIFDTHFIERGRFGRLIAFMYNAYRTLNKNIIGIGLDDRTALCIDPEGTATVFGSGSVSIFHKDEMTIYEGNGTEYTIENLRCDQLLQGWKYDLPGRRIVETPADVSDFNSTENTSAPVTNIWLSGNNHLQNNIENGIQHFLNETNTDKIVVLFNEGYHDLITDLLIYLDTNSSSYSEIPVSSSVLNQQEYVEIITNATAFIATGNNLLELNLLSDESNSLGAAFLSKVSSTPIYFIGNTGKASGDFFIGDVDGYEYAGYYGRMTNNDGLGLYNDLIFQPLMFDDPDYYENRTSALLWGLAVNQKRIGLYLDNSDFVKISTSGIIESYGSLPIIILDTRLSSTTGYSNYIAGGNKTRQIVGLDNLRYTISSISRKYNLNTSTDTIDSESAPKNFMLNQNYPNPFNGSTTIPFSLYTPSNVEVDIYDSIGRKVTHLFDGIKQAGSHIIRFDTTKLNKDLTSGIYFYIVKVDKSIVSGKMVYLK